MLDVVITFFPVISTPTAAGSRQSLPSASFSALAPANVSFRLEKDFSGSNGKDKSSRREKASSTTSTAATAVEDMSSENLETNTGDASAVISVVATDADAATAAADADSGSEDAAPSSQHEAGMLAAVSEVQERVEEDDGSPSLVVWQARDAAAVARQPHPCPLPQALFAPDILLPPQQAAALAGGAAPPKRSPSKPFLAFMEGLSALQCVSQSGVVSLDIERIFPLGPCNDSLRCALNCNEVALPVTFPKKVAYAQ